MSATLRAEGANVPDARKAPDAVMRPLVEAILAAMARERKEAAA